MERLCPGLLYMFILHGTTIGTPEDRSSSAIFFTTDELTRDRFQNLTKNQKGELCKKKETISMGKVFTKKQNENIYYQKDETRFNQLVQNHKN
jgi:hypothetical protein